VLLTQLTNMAALRQIAGRCRILKYCSINTTIERNTGDRQTTSRLYRTTGKQTSIHTVRAAAVDAILLLLLLLLLL